ncbi:hypothetical protein BASA50_002561 [Batrachochytrium salamandrivorans]|uniref:Oxysterol-binding protein n=1 Tax=Batrachochytrium salamandrivorans TaxID=1357716 RepID=A0ABQ8FKZ5_9FUNG|nr:hypothetical protein BASA50_002561 [Batrachochytrium salamandrivorans]KAH9276133.1 hypothetical protein BASA83_001407 [Batrachochytrium salamandrivorans]KAJ1330575.1 hypothetical protein BSLG_009337 [Batrachochytrium salamandrivorans]
MNTASSTASSTKPTDPSNEISAEATDIPEQVEFDGNSSKLKFVFGLLTRFIGVKDLVSMRISLPANLLEPQSNLEFWNYVDRPDLFVSIPDGTSPLERMLRTVRFWYSKDTKWKDNHLRKPYNPILGEQYICHWKIPQTETTAPDTGASTTTAETRAAVDSSVADVSAGLEKTSLLPPMVDAAEGVQPEHDHDKPPLTRPLPQDPTASMPLSMPSAPPAPPSHTAALPATTAFCITEQISHHPPISAFTYTSHDSRIVISGLDHVVAKFTGTSFKVGPGEYNAGIYVTLKDHNETYNISHPWATVNGWLTGSPYIVVSDQTVIVCPNSGIKAILVYLDEPFFGSPKFAIQGKIFKYDFGKDLEMTPKQRKDMEKLGNVPDEDVLCTISGKWNGEIFFQMAGSAEQELLFDMSTSNVAPKSVQSLAQQGELESGRVWQRVTDALLLKDYTTATREKRIVEERQRKATALRLQSTTLNFTPVYFEFKTDFMEMSGKPGPPVDMEKGRPFLKSHVLEQLMAGISAKSEKDDTFENAKAEVSLLSST